MRVYPVVVEELEALLMQDASPVGPAHVWLGGTFPTCSISLFSELLQGVCKQAKQTRANNNLTPKPFSTVVPSAARHGRAAMAQCFFFCFRVRLSGNNPVGCRDPRSCIYDVEGGMESRSRCGTSKARAAAAVPKKENLYKVSSHDT